MLPSDIFSNVEVTNGKVITSDGQVIVAGIGKLSDLAGDAPERGKLLLKQKG